MNLLSFKVGCVIGDLGNAIRKNTTLRFGLYHSLYEWFNPLYLRDKSSGFKENNFVQVKFCLRLAFKRLVNLAFFLVQNDARII